jgi:hypothetical protein
MAPVTLEIELTAWDNQDSVRGGMTALPNAAAGATNGLPLSVDSSGRVSIGSMAANTLTASALATDAVTEIQSGLSTLDAAGIRTAVGLAAANLDTQLSTLQADTDNIQTRLPAALVSGRMDASVGAMAANTLTASAVATDAVAEIQTGLSTLDVAGIRSAIGMASANLDTQLNSLASQATTIAGYLDTEILAIKAKTDALPASPAATGDIPTAAAIRAEIDSNSTKLDVAVSTRLASTSYTAPLDAAGVRTAVGLASANLDTQLDALPTATENADALLKRDWTSVTGEAGRSLLNAARVLRNKVVIAGGTITVYKEDGTTVAFTMTAATDAAADPIVSQTP